MSPYIVIDKTRFQILPAVPGVTLLKTSKKKKNFVETSEKPRVRGNKAINTAGDVFVPDIFNPLPAVPNKLESADKNDSNVKENVVAHITPKVNVKEENALISPKEERKRFRKCHGQCVQKSCFPIGSLTVFNNCSENCRNICTN